MIFRGVRQIVALGSRMPERLLPRISDLVYVLKRAERDGFSGKFPLNPSVQTQNGAALEAVICAFVVYINDAACRLSSSVIPPGLTSASGVMIEALGA